MSLVSGICSLTKQNLTNIETDDTDIELLLQIFAVCRVRGIQLPLDMIGAQMRTKSGAPILGNAITQHIAKLRKKRLEQGLPVPGLISSAFSGSVSGNAGPSKANKSSRSSRSSTTALDAADQDNEADANTDEAADSDGSFGEPLSTNRNAVLTSKKRGALRNDSEDKEEKQNIKAKGNSAANDKRKQVKKEESPRLSNVTAAGHFSRGPNLDYAKLNGDDTESKDEND